MTKKGRIAEKPQKSSQSGQNGDSGAAKCVPAGPKKPERCKKTSKSRIDPVTSRKKAAVLNSRLIMAKKRDPKSAHS